MRRPTKPIPKFAKEQDHGLPAHHVNPDQMDGLPRIRGLRILVVTVVNMVASGMSNDEILELYPYLEAEDIDEALRFADSN